MIIQYPNSQEIQEFPSIKKLDKLYPKMLQECSSKELLGLSEPFIAYYLEHYLRTHPKVLERLTEQSRPEESKAYKETISIVKGHARAVYGVFSKKTNKVEETLAQLARKHTSQQEQEVLMLHKSTEERIDHYGAIQSWLFSHVAKKKLRILDIAAGFHPFASKTIFGKRTIAQYDTIEVSEHMSKAYDQFFNGKYKHYVTHFPVYYEEICKQLGDYDVVFALKTFDTLERQQRHMTVKLLGLLKADILIASFNLNTIKNTAMDRTQAGWFEKVIRQKNLKLIDARRFGNELFYAVKL